MLTARRHKYGARPTTWAGRRFDSQAEADYAAQLRLLEQAGEIADVEMQPKIVLIPDVLTYRPDFVFTERGRPVYVDVKGVLTSDRLRIVLRAWAKFGPGPLRLVKRARRGDAFLTVREILPKGAGT